MPKFFKLVGRILFELCIHTAAGSVIFAAFLPLAKWYINHNPILGVDFYNMAANAAYYSRHFDPRYLGYKSIAWGGFPYVGDYPSLHFYLIRPLVDRFGPQIATFYYTMGAMYLLALCSYFLFFAISKNAILAVVLSILGLYSIGMWGTVIWGGNLQYFATMLFLPLSLGFLVLYLQAKTRKHLIASGVLAGISTLGHPQVMASYILPFSIFVLLFGYFENIGAGIKRRVADLLIFLFAVTLVGYVQLQMVLGGVIFFAPLNAISFADNIISSLVGTKLNYGYAIPSTVSDEAAHAIAAYNRGEFWRFKTEINTGFFVLAAVSIALAILGLVIGRVRKRMLGILPYLLFLGFLFGYTYALSRGFSLFHGGWYRVFWPMPIAFGVLISFGYRNFWMGLVERLGGLNTLWLRLILFGVISAVVLIAGYGFILKTNATTLEDRMDNGKLREKSGAYPDILNKPSSQKEFIDLAKKLVPAWLPVNDHQYRIYSGDQKVNIWWPTYFEMPMFRGYNDAPVGTDRAGGYFWTDIAIASNSSKDSLVDDFKTPRDMAKNNALFLIDWFSIGYFEGGHGGSDSFNPPASYLLLDKNIFEREEEVKLPGYVEVYNNAQYGNKMHFNDTISRSLRYFKFKEGLASPIAAATNATVVGFCGTFNNWETFLRVLGGTNTNSKRVVPLRLCESIRDLPDFGIFSPDALVLYGYLDGKDRRSLSKIDKYVKDGGKLFIETGSDVFQSSSDKLPEFFPISGTRRGEIGTSWDIPNFSPPTLDDKPWLFSLATGVKNGSEEILKAGEFDLVVLGNYGQGKVIWSGANLFFHANTYKNTRETEYVRDLLAKLVSLDVAKGADSKADFISNTNIKISTSGSRAVMLREVDDGGWRAKINGRPAAIYKTGPVYPGFAYVFIPKDLISGQTEVEFTRHWDRWTFSYTVLSILIIIFAFDYFFGSRIFRLILKPIKNRAGKKVLNWWRKEDE